MINFLVTCRQETMASLPGPRKSVMYYYDIFGNSFKGDNKGSETKGNSFDFPIGTPAQIITQSEAWNRKVTGEIVPSAGTDIRSQWYNSSMSFDGGISDGVYGPNKFA